MYRDEIGQPITHFLEKSRSTSLNGVKFGKFKLNDQFYQEIVHAIKQ